MCWTRSNVSLVEQHVLLLDAERVRVALAELVLEHAAARGAKLLPVIDAG